MGHKMHDTLSMGLMEFDTEEYVQSVEEQFKAGASMEDGVSGKKKIDTTYENNRPAENVHPRSAQIPGEDP